MILTLNLIFSVLLLLGGNLYVTSYSTLLTTPMTRSIGSYSSLYMAGFGKTSAPKVEETVIDQGSDCKCGSGLKYGSCCGPVHAIGGSDNPEKVVRSRFSALIYGLVPHMVKTTHNTHKEFVPEEQVSKRKKWIKDLDKFSSEYKFLELKFEDDAVTFEGDKAFVSFAVKLVRSDLEGRTPERIEEISTFLKDGTNWLYAGY